MKNEKIEASVGMSREWDARQAGREVAQNTLKKLDHDPNFFLLFSTIHYEKHGGFDEFLEGVWEILPKGTPLIGGTVAGFVNNFGCFTRGASALAVSYSKMDVVVGFGKNTKRNPKKAAKKSYQTIKKGLSDSEYGNKFLLNLVAGPGKMKIPGKGYTLVVNSGFVSKFVMQAFGISQYLLQKGFGREDEIFEEMASKLPDFKMILGTSMDDYRGLCHYQFYNKEVITNSLLSLGISTDVNLDVFTNHGMNQTDIKFDITKMSRNKHIIHEINHKPAVPEISRILNWPEGFLTDKTMLKTILYYPISLKRNNREVPAVIPFILKDSIMIPCVIDKGNVSILTVSGGDLANSINDNLSHFRNINPDFGLFSTCVTIFETLGKNLNGVREDLSNYFGEKPFLMFACAGEGTYSPENDITYANMSYNTAIFGNNKFI